MTTAAQPPARGIEIPRVFHRIWFGSKLPEEYRRYGETWREHHPGWEMRLWTEKNLPELEDPGALERARHHAERSNILRYALLARFGGVYVDTDFECLRNIEPLLGGVQAFSALVRPGRVANGILGAVPGHPAFRRALEESTARVGEGRSSILATGPKFMSDLLEQFPDVTIFGSERFYPYDWTEEPRSAAELPEAYAIHHWRKTGTTEPDDPEAKVEFLKARLARARRQRKGVRRKRRRTKEQWRDERRAARRAQRRLAAIEASLWWRMNPGRLVARLTRRDGR